MNTPLALRHACLAEEVNGKEADAGDEVVAKGTKTSEELLKTIAESMDQPDLFREPMVFQRLKQ